MPTNATLVNYTFAFGSNLKEKYENYRIFKDEENYYVQMMEDNNYIYQCPSNPTLLYEYFKSCHAREYDFHHDCVNLTNYHLLEENEAKQLEVFTFDFYIDRFLYYHVQE